MSALLKRQFLLYFRSRSGIFFSILGALISFILYIVFLQHQLENAWSQVPNSKELLNNWLMGGTLVVTGITTSLASLSQLVKDREHKVDKDLFLVGLGRWRLYFSYLLSSILISFVMQGFMYALMCLYFKINPSWEALPEFFGVMLLSSILSSLVNLFFVLFFHSVDSLGKFSTLIGTASGFLVGTYVPLGVLPSGAQLLVKLTPGSYIAALYRQVLMQDKLQGVSFVVDGERFGTYMGIQLSWKDILTREQTYLIVVGVIVLAVICIVGLTKLQEKKK